MSSGNIRGRVQTVQDSPRPRERRKAILSCPRCGHKSPADGDWVEVFTEDRVVSERDDPVIIEDRIEVRCPDCYKRLTTRLPGWE